MLTRVCYGDEIFGHAMAPAITAVYVKWKTLTQLKKLSLTEFLDVSDKSADKFTVLISTGDDYGFIYHGAGFRESLGYDLSATFLSDIDTHIARQMHEVYDRVRQTRIPAWMVFGAVSAKLALLWERIILPLPVKGECRVLIAYTEVVNSTFEVYDHLFKALPIMLIAALPELGKDGIVTDASIVSANPAAAKFFGFEHPARSPVNLRRLRPWFDDDETWRMLAAQPAVGAPDRILGVEHDGQRFQVVVTRLEHLLLFRIQNASKRAAANG